MISFSSNYKLSCISQVFQLLLGSVVCSKCAGIKGDLSSVLNLIYTDLFFPPSSFPFSPKQMITILISKEKQDGGKRQLGWKLASSYFHRIFFQLFMNTTSLPINNRKQGLFHKAGL